MSPCLRPRPNAEAPTHKPPGVVAQSGLLPEIARGANARRALRGRQGTGWGSTWWGWAVVRPNFGVAGRARDQQTEGASRLHKGTAVNPDRLPGVALAPQDCPYPAASMTGWSKKRPSSERTSPWAAHRTRTSTACAGFDPVRAVPVVYAEEGVVGADPLASAVRSERVEVPPAWSGRHETPDEEWRWV